jgi:murein DD-endopeptidase MepM/ murein hydrolase activator NlpD
MKGGKILGGCLIATMLGVLIFIILSTLVVEAARQSSPFGKEQIKEWMLGTPQPVGSEFSDNGYVNAGVGVGWKDFTHPNDPSRPRGVPFDFKAKLGCEYRDPNYVRHTGVDFPEPIGTNVYATMAGLVVYAEVNGPWGNLVVVENNGYQTYYAHLDSFEVGKGQVVSRGQMIGTVGNNGNSTGPHLHYGIKKRTGKDSYIWVDPEGFFNRSDTKEWPCN